MYATVRVLRYIFWLPANFGDLVAGFAGIAISGGYTLAIGTAGQIYCTRKRAKRGSLLTFSRTRPSTQFRSFSSRAAIMFRRSDLLSEHCSYSRSRFPALDQSQFVREVSTIYCFMVMCTALVSSTIFLLLDMKEL